MSLLLVIPEGNLLFFAVPILYRRNITSANGVYEERYRNLRQRDYPEMALILSYGIFADMEQLAFDRAYYQSRPNKWLPFRLLAYEDVGKLTISAAAIVFESSKQRLTIDRIQRVSFGKQGRDFVNDWVKVEYLRETDQPTIAFFADGGSLGWSGVAGGTVQMLNAIKRIPTAPLDRV